MIITKIEQLHLKSLDVENGDNANRIIMALRHEMSQHPHAVGLAAPQIGLLNRVFIARLSTGYYSFVNPVVTVEDASLLPSVERCLSLPGISRTVERHYAVKITGHIGDWNNDVMMESLMVSGFDAYVVQHEMDHLDGILITDHPEVTGRFAKFLSRQQKRQFKLNKRRTKNVVTPALAIE